MNDNTNTSIGKLHMSILIYKIKLKNRLRGMKFIESFADLLAKLQNSKTLLLIFVDPSILTPSESLIKYFTFSPIAMQLESNIYAYKGTEIKMFQFFNILNYPQVTVVKDKPSNVLFNFIGCNQERAWQALTILATSLGYGKPHRKLNVQRKLCPKGHELKLINEMIEANYRNGFFLCNGCNMLSHVEIDKPILHCSVCEYDLCNGCAYIESMT